MVKKNRSLMEKKGQIKKGKPHYLPPNMRHDEEPMTRFPIGRLAPSFLQKYKKYGGSQTLRLASLKVRRFHIRDSNQKKPD